MVIPTRDRAGLLEQTLRSVEEQSARVAEVIVVDDGSTDRTESVLARHGATRVHNAAGGWGPGRARNEGLARVSTDLVLFVDSDDLLLPNAIAALRSALRGTPGAPFAYGRALVAELSAGGWEPRSLIATGTRERRDLRCALLARNSVPSSGALVRTAAARRAEGYDASIPLGQDHHFWLRLSRRGLPVPIDELVCIYRRHGSNTRRDALAASDHARAVLDLAAEDPALRPCVADRLAVELTQQSIAAVKAGHPARLVGAARQLLRGRRDRLSIAREALAYHLLVRRPARRAGLELWRTRPELRSWLATYSGEGVGARETLRGGR